MIVQEFCCSCVMSIESNACCLFFLGGGGLMVEVMPQMLQSGQAVGTERLSCLRHLPTFVPSPNGDTSECVWGRGRWEQPRDAHSDRGLAHKRPASQRRRPPVTGQSKTWLLSRKMITEQIWKKQTNRVVWAAHRISLCNWHSLQNEAKVILCGGRDFFFSSLSGLFWASGLWKRLMEVMQRTASLHLALRTVNKGIFSGVCRGGGVEIRARLLFKRQKRCLLISQYLTRLRSKKCSHLFLWAQRVGETCSACVIQNEIAWSEFGNIAGKNRRVHKVTDNIYTSRPGCGIRRSISWKQVEPARVITTYKSYMDFLKLPLFANQSKQLDVIITNANTASLRSNLVSSSFWWTLVATLEFRLLLHTCATFLLRQFGKETWQTLTLHPAAWGRFLQHSQDESQCFFSPISTIYAKPVLRLAQRSCWVCRRNSPECKYHDLFGPKCQTDFHSGSVCRSHIHSYNRTLNTQTHSVCVSVPSHCQEKGQ